MPNFTTTKIDLGFVTWEAFAWLTIQASKHLTYEAAPQDTIYLVSLDTWTQTKFILEHHVNMDVGTYSRQEAWEILGNTVG